MFSATSLLVLACACAATVNAQAACSPLVQINDVTDYPVKLQVVALPPKVQDYSVQIPDVPECVNGVAGAQAYACDVDVAPSAYFQSMSILNVHRNGNTLQAGIVAVTVFCNV